CRHLKIPRGDKTETVAMPDLDEKLTWAFLRGQFDGDGYVSKLTEKRNKRTCSISSRSTGLKNAIKEFAKIRGMTCYINYAEIIFTGVNSLNFLKGMY